MKKAIFSNLLILILTLLLFSTQAPAQKQNGLSTADFVSGMEAEVKEVIDGCTIRLDSGETVSYRGVRIPEGSGRVWEDLQKKGKAANNKLVKGKKVRLEFDEVRRDAQKNLFAYVYVGDILVNGEILASGYAVMSFAPPPLKNRDVLIMLELSAREGSRGFWSSEFAPPAPGMPRAPAQPNAPQSPKR